MIDEKNLIEQLEKYKDEWNATNAFSVGILSGLQLAIETTYKQSKVCEWIPVSERLPEDNKMSEYYDSVIVTLDSGRVVSGCYVNCYEEWWVDAEDGEKCSINATGRVIAWMPLPEPYEED